MDNPVFVTYVIASAIMVIKIMGQGWMTVFRMLKIDAGWATPEDMRGGLINRNPRPGQLDPNDYECVRDTDSVEVTESDAVSDATAITA